MGIGDLFIKVPGVMVVVRIINRIFHKGIDESKKISVLEYLFNERVHGNRYEKYDRLQFWYRKRWRHENDSVGILYDDELAVILGDYEDSGTLKREEKSGMGPLVSLTENGFLLYTTNKNIAILKCRTWIAFIVAITSIIFGILTFYCKCP